MTPSGARPPCWPVSIERSKSKPPSAAGDSATPVRRLFGCARALAVRRPGLLRGIRRLAIEDRSRCTCSARGPTAARIEDAAGESLIRDHGAVAEISGAAAAAASELAARVQRAVPDGEVIVHIEEPELSRVLDGRVPMSSGRLFHRAVEPAVVQAHLSTIVNAVAAANAVACIRCAAPGAPVELMLGTGARIIGIDIEQPMRSASAHESLLAAWESGVGSPAVVRPGPDRRLAERRRRQRPSSPIHGDERVSRRYRRTSPSRPTSGLAHLSPEGARAVMDACTRVGVVVRDEHSEPVHG